MHPGDEILVLKCNPEGEETWRYRGTLIEKTTSYVRLEATFDRDDTDLHGLLLGRGDLFLETFYTDRWYNVFEIHARDSGQLRGWYCNIGRPAELEGDRLSYVDLALDLLVFPDGRQVVLDEDEFRQLDIPEAWCAQARQALAELQAEFRRKLA